MQNENLLLGRYSLWISIQIVHIVLKILSILSLFRCHTNGFVRKTLDGACMCRHWFHSSKRGHSSYHNVNKIVVFKKLSIYWFRKADRPIGFEGNAICPNTRQCQSWRLHSYPKQLIKKKKLSKQPMVETFIMLLLTIHIPSNSSWE